jgi:hypothetical protein
MASTHAIKRMTWHSELGPVFVRVALPAFQFLISEFGYRLVANDGCSNIKYASDSVLVSVDYEYGFEIDVTIGLLDELSNAVPLRLVVELGGGELEPLIQASTEERLRTFVPLLAMRLREFGRDALSGDRTIFEELMRMGQADADATTRDFAQRQLHRKIESAWRDKEYKKVVTLLESLPDRTPLDDKRLNYARDQLAHS